MLPASTQTIRNTIPNAAMKEKTRIIGIRPLRFHEYHWGVNCGRKGNEINQSKLLLLTLPSPTVLIGIFKLCLNASQTLSAEKYPIFQLLISTPIEDFLCVITPMTIFSSDTHLIGSQLRILKPFPNTRQKCRNRQTESQGQVFHSKSSKRTFLALICSICAVVIQQVRYTVPSVAT